MISRMPLHAPGSALPLSRRSFLTAMAALTGTGLAPTSADPRSNKKETSEMTRNAFVYTELQASVPFTDVPWPDLNAAIAAEPGFVDKTWLSGMNTASVGGLYSFASVADALHYCTHFFPALAHDFGVAQTTRVFGTQATAEASADLASPYFGGTVSQEPGAFVYTEVQVAIPFEQAPWRDRNPVLRAQEGLLSKTWLSGHNTRTLGGLDAFDTVENATRFALVDFPKTAASMNAAFYTRIFDARVTEAASRALNSPYYL